MDRKEIEELIERLEAHITECQAGLDHDEYFGELPSLDRYSKDGMRSRDAVDALRHLLQAQTWRPISEFHGNDGLYLTYCSKAPVHLSPYQVVRYKERHGQWLTNWEPTHWLAFPLPPSEQQNEGEE